MERGGTPESAIINHEPEVYKRFSQLGLTYLMPLHPSFPQIEIKQPRSFLEGTNLTNMEHTSANPIPVYTLPEITDPENEIPQNLLAYILGNVHALSQTNSSFGQLENMLNTESEYAYRSAKIIADELEANTEDPQLNKLISLATYGLDYPPQNAGNRSASVSMSIGNLHGAVRYLQNYSSFEPDLRAVYSLLLIYKAGGVDYTEEPMHYDVFGKKSPQWYGVKITDNETLRDKLQAVVLIPWADESKKLP